MLRRFIALLILLFTVWSLISAYMYFFIYSTATITLESNVGDYEAQLYAKKTAQKKQFSCPEMRCELPDIAPLTYTLTISKDDYELYTIPVQVKAHRNETIVVTLEKRPKLTRLSTDLSPTPSWEDREQEQSEENITSGETQQEQIARLREAGKHYATIYLWADNTIVFDAVGESLEMYYQTPKDRKKMTVIAPVSAEEISGEYVGESEDIFMRAGNTSYLYRHSSGEMSELPFEMSIDYIKHSQTPGSYYIVTQNGTFLYNAMTKTSQYQYLFRDFIVYGDDIIGLVGADETQKIQNFGYPETGNLVILYSLQDKTRRVIYSLESLPSRIKSRDGKVILTLSDGEYELSNF